MSKTRELDKNEIDLHMDLDALDWPLEYDLLGNTIMLIKDTLGVSLEQASTVAHYYQTRGQIENATTVEDLKKPFLELFYRAYK